MRLKTIMESLGYGDIQDIVDEMLYSLGRKGPKSGDVSIMDGKAIVELVPWPPNSKADMIKIERIKVDEEERGKGLGSKIMNIICHIADNHQIPVVLSAVPFGDKKNDRGDKENTDKLINFYQQFGFEIVSREEKKSLGIFGDVMIRRYSK